jgi:hypothetical protein
MADLYKLMKDDPRAVVDLISGLVRKIARSDQKVSVNWGRRELPGTLYAAGRDLPVKLWVEDGGSQ